MEIKRKKIIIVGGGAAGMMAAVTAAERDNEVIIIEKNEKLGKKLFITGKGRCNYCNDCDNDTLIASTITNPKFMYSAYKNLDPGMTIEFFEKLGLRSKVERGNRVFPASDKSSDVIKVLEKELKKLGVKIYLNTKVKSLILDDIPGEDTKKECRGVVLLSGEKMKADRVVVATGGKSYPLTGSTGDGYEFAKSCGHDITRLRPALCALTTDTEYVTRMQGVSLKNVSVKIIDEEIKKGSQKKGKVIYSAFGEMLFTHFGVSGPVILTGESYIVERLDKGPLKMLIDFKPALDEKTLDQRILREIESARNISFKNLLRKLLPAKVAEVFPEICGVCGDKKAGDLTKKERLTIIEYLKEFPLTITGTRGFDEAIITRGGVNVKEIDPKTFASKKAEGVYFIGEILDTDAVTGGFNLQIAWSSAYSCGKNI